jgi:hypothetical protein
VHDAQGVGGEAADDEEEALLEVDPETTSITAAAATPTRKVKLPT